jgi:precorrin-8X/cobalt-precorrin-8 methylmutase
MDYLCDPAAIYARSFAAIRAEADLSPFSGTDQVIAIRMIHACGMTDLVNDLVISPDFAEASRAALRTGRPVCVDSEMVRHGINLRALPAGNDIVCTLNDPAARDAAARQATTRSAAAVDLWKPRLSGAVAVIGNAPTALFHLLELIDDGAPKPAAIIGCPVGFVGAAESKAELAANPRGIPFLTVKGRRGGSALAAAVVNALTGDMP